MSDSAFTLAAMRAGGAYAVSEHERSAAEAVATRAGRRVVEVQGQPGATTVALGFADGYEPNPGEDVFSVRRLTPIPLIALATCIGLCWRDRDTTPYPGEAVSIEQVVAAAGALGAPTPHLRGALRSELVMSGLVQIEGGSVRLGPAIASWTDTQIDALRRFADHLPGGDDA